jgi:hypothetical protein
MPALSRDYHETTMTRTRFTLITAVALLALGSVGCVDDTALEPLPPPPPKESELVHYWHFNALPEGTLTGPVASDFSKMSGASITYPGTGLGYMDRVDPGSDINAQQGAVPGFGLRPRNPANTRELIIIAPTTGYEKIVVAFAAMRSSNGAAQEDFSYSVDGGTTWVVVGAAYDIALEWAAKTIDLSSISAVNNAANLRFRIRFLGDLAAGSSGNNRLDNITIDGVPLS